MSGRNDSTTKGAATDRSRLSIDAQLIEAKLTRADRRASDAAAWIAALDGIVDQLDGIDDRKAAASMLDRVVAQLEGSEASIRSVVEIDATPLSKALRDLPMIAFPIALDSRSHWSLGIYAIAKRIKSTRRALDLAIESGARRGMEPRAFAIVAVARIVNATTIASALATKLREGSAE
jgi:hypothetical protein